MDGGPPYARIAAELRGQIERGELLPGQRVPSTRQITARWGVAMATATRVLATLRSDGLVHPRPGVGTVVSEPPAVPPHRSPAVGPGGPPAAARPAAAPAQPPAGRPNADRPNADRPDAGRPDAGRPAPDPARAAADRGPGGAERIVAAAITVADTEGLAALSMRRVAAELGAAPMSLYRHVADKDDLVLQMMNTVFGRSRLPDPPDGWRPRLEVAARTFWEMFRAHPWLASALSLTRPQVLPAALPYTEWVLTALDGQGLDLDAMFTAYLTLINYVRGVAVNLESEAEAEAASGLDSEEWLVTQESQIRSVLVPGRFPMFEALISEEYDFSLDRLFEFGLQRLLDGLATLISAGLGGRTPQTPPPRATPA
jgi:AcrR family transcriptional regulator